MAHFLYKMSSTAPAPAGDGDTKSWFFHYKWCVEGEVYVPVRRPFLPVEVGDYLWFCLDGVVFGGARILRVEEEQSQGRQELWYADITSQQLEQPVTVPAEWLISQRVSPEEGARWLGLRQRTPTMFP